MPSADFQTLTPIQVESRINAEPNIKLVDVRTPEEHAAYHIPGSLLLPLQQLPGLIAGRLDPEDEIIVYCEHGVRSRHAAQYLVSQDFEHVAHMAGGMAAWTGPVEDNAL